jgi:hypothetical protein
VVCRKNVDAQPFRRRELPCTIGKDRRAKRLPVEQIVRWNSWLESTPRR